ncbi:MAG TPA: hypothetical protein VKS79_08270 [Gemmataceae bacterium]|nr:hypothetical protein [Gemmataceae bacterium]
MHQGTVGRALCALILLFVSLNPGYSQDKSSPIYPNLLVEIGLDFANAAGSQVIDRFDPVNRPQGKMQINGTTHTQAQVNFGFVPNYQMAVMELHMWGNTSACTTATRGKVDAHVATQLSYMGHKQLFLTENGFCSAPGETSANLDYNILTGVNTQFRRPIDPLVRRLVHHVYDKKKSQIDSQVYQSGSEELQKQFETNALKTLAEANARYYEKLRDPMTRRGIFPQRVRLMTSDHQLGLRSLLLEPTGKAQHFAPVPDIQGWPDLAVRVEESMLNNASHTIFAGKSFDGPALDKEFSTFLKPLMGEPVETTEKGEEFSITFPEEKPIEIHFRDQGFEVTIRGEEFSTERGAFDGMNTTGFYKLEKTDTGLIAKRQGELKVYPPNFVEGKDKLSLREKTMQELLRRKFGKVMKPEFVVEEIKLPEAMRKAGNLVTTQVESNNGWLVLGWRRKGAQ